MLGREYYRRQADICLALSRLAEDPIMAEALIAKANEFLAKAAEAGRDADVPVPSRVVIEHDESDGDDVGRDWGFAIWANICRGIGKIASFFTHGRQHRRTSMGTR
jgi:hypothetical protein